MEALKEFDIEELLKRQAMLDKKFDEKETVRERNPIRIYIAYFTELGELAQELKSEWKNTMNYLGNNVMKVDPGKIDTDGENKKLN
nr:MAG TPA: dUTPase [Caudoviricetes sp.]